MRSARAFLLSLALFFSVLANAQQDSACAVRISLLTCSPGVELYSAFGHTAIRVTDTSTGTDLVFNYGTFDDRNPTEFYANFTKGLMRYALSVYPYSDFLQEYQLQQRGVIEQVLELSCAAKQALQKSLLHNAEEQNRFYNYYFHTDNCTTRARDMITQHVGAPIAYTNFLPPDSPSFRSLIHRYLDKSGQYWSKFGIDILLGAHLDKQVNIQEAMFLPDYLLKGIDNATVNGKPFDARKNIIIAAPPIDSDARTLITPVIFFTGLLILVLALSFAGSGWAKKILLGFDMLFFLFLGIIGVLLVTLWIIRIDTVCRNNWNILWALPTHLPVAFVLWSKKIWVKKYFRWVSILTLLVAVCWFFLPQQLNPAVLPILGIILARAWYRSK